MVSEKPAQTPETSPDDAGDEPRPPPRGSMDWVVFGLALLMCTGFVGWGVADADGLAVAAQSALDRILDSFGWLYVLALTGLVAVAAFLAFSRYGRIRLGGDGERPEFSTGVWITMLFAAGMGTGLVFWGVAEPLSHLADPPLGGAEPGSAEATRLSMEYTIFHWGLHTWSLYALIGLPLAYGIFRKGRPSLISSVVCPNKPTTSLTSRSVNAFSVFLTTFGAATSLGLGAIQINDGLAATFGIPVNNTVAIATIVGVTLLFVVSAVSGLHRGIKHISTINAVLAGLIMAFVFVAGPSVNLIQTYIEALGGYVSGFLPMATETGLYGGGEWVNSWTVFYWGWWMGYAPFVGTFVARISRGRTIREFVLAVLAAPTALSLLWFSIVGGTAMHVDRAGDGELTGALDASGEGAVLFALFEQLPLTAIASVLVIVLIVLFFVSSADSASIVLGMFCQGGTLAPRRGIVVVWGSAIALTAIVLVLTGGVAAVQTVSIVIGLPFLAILVVAAVRFVLEIRSDHAESPEPSGVH